MGEVHLAVLEAVGGVRKLLAIKLSLLDEPELQTGLLREARLGALVVHPHVVQTLDAGIEGTRAWFAMEYVAGVSLAKLFALPEESRVPNWTWARILADACSALHAVHEARDEEGRPLNIIHRDITPQNLLLGWNGVLKLVDLGIARSALQQRTTSAGILKGKLGYMSPEQASGGQVDRRSDIFSLGVLLWEALAGRKLFAGSNDAETLASIIRCEVPSLADVDPKLPPALQPIVARALSPSPSSRYGSALEMQRALESALCENRIIIGAHEVAQLLQTLDLGDDAIARTALPSLPSTLRMDPQAHSVKPATPRTRKLAALLIGIAAVVGALFVSTRLVNLGGSSVLRPQTPLPPRSVEARTAELVTPIPVAGPVVTIATAAMPLETTPKSDASPAKPLGGRSRRREGADHKMASSPAEEPRSAPSLNISSRPVWASIRIDKKPRGSTPLVINDLGPGPHDVEAFPQGKSPSRQKTVVLKAGVVERLDFQFALDAESQ